MSTFNIENNGGSGIQIIGNDVTINTTTRTKGGVVEETTVINGGSGCIAIGRNAKVVQHNIVFKEPEPPLYAVGRNAKAIRHNHVMDSLASEGKKAEDDGFVLMFRKDGASFPQSRGCFGPELPKEYPFSVWRNRGWVDVNYLRRTVKLGGCCYYIYEEE